MTSNISELEIKALPVLEDNIIWVLVLDSQAVVVDPSVSEPVQNWLEAHDLDLIAILQTHHHQDHIGGSIELIKRWPKAEVIAAKADLERIPFQTISVANEDQFRLLGHKIEVIEVIGHTKFHIAFFIDECKNASRKPALFPGDTLFSGGCGRLFEGTPTQMYDSLKKLNSLPKHTEIYCAHEYTESNLRWANSIFPENQDIRKSMKKVARKRSLGYLSLPTTLEEERKINLFLRAKTLDDFSTLRSHKDNWK